MPDTLILTHGAGLNRNAPLLVEVDGALSALGVRVTRVDLPYRIERRTGPPRPGDAARDRAGLREMVVAARAAGDGRVFLGGHSYGGRQASMLAAEEPGLVDGLLLLSYPLHPPKKREQLRTAHFGALRGPVLFVHGTRDPLGLPAELEAAVGLIPGPVRVVFVERAGHDLRGAGGRVAAAWGEWISHE